jgi:hypothetical protein
MVTREGWISDPSLYHLPPLVPDSPEKITKTAVHQLSAERQLCADFVHRPANDAQVGKRSVEDQEAESSFGPTTQRLF